MRDNPGRLPFTVCVSLAWALAGYGQLSGVVSSDPEQWAVERIVIPFDPLAYVVEDEELQAQGRPPVYGRVVPVHIDPLMAGEWSRQGDGMHHWRLTVEVAGALGLELFLDGFSPPNGASLHLFNDQRTEELGGYEAQDAVMGGVLAPPRLDGSVIHVEYVSPVGPSDRPPFRITGVGCTYREDGWSKAGACNVDVKCPEAAAWQAQVDGVVRIGVRVNNVLYWCSGSLVNNTANDCKPYILTALHCGLGSSAQDLANYKFYFGYQRSACGSGAALANKVITGCHKRADSNDGGGTSGSDFLLLEMVADPPTAWSPYWMGWDATGLTGPGGVSIHHPSGSEKKISTYAITPLTSQWVPGGPPSHWYVTWVATASGHGVTEGGSSGSPLIDGQGRIIGTLTGGTSCCTTNGCGLPGSGPTTPDYYGKMNYHWTLNPNPADQKLKAWLDPLNSGQMVLDGSYDPCGIGVAELLPHALPGCIGPVDGRWWIELPEAWLGAWVEVVDLTGRTMWAGAAVPGAARHEVRLAGSPPGFYVCRVLHQGKSWTGRLVHASDQ